MRVPRHLPAILPQEKYNPTTYTSLSNPNTTSIRHQSNRSTSYLITTGSTSYSTTTRSTSYSTTTNCSTGNATTGCATTGSNFFVVLAWGCTALNGLKSTNASPLDNWMTIFQSLVKSHMLNLDDLDEPAKLIKNYLCLLDSHQYGDAKLVLIPQTLHLAYRSCFINLYRNEADYFLKLTRTILAAKVTSTCVLHPVLYTLPLIKHAILLLMNVLHLKLLYLNGLCLLIPRVKEDLKLSHYLLFQISKC